MWELDCEKSWAPKNWCFWTVVLAKTLASPLDCKEISPGCSLEGLMLRLKLQYFGCLIAKSWLIGKDLDAGSDWGQEEKGTTEDEMAGWHHWLDTHEFEWTRGIGDGQGGLVCCDSWARKESDTTERLNWGATSLNVLLNFIWQTEQDWKRWSGVPEGSVTLPPRKPSESSPASYHVSWAKTWINKVELWGLPWWSSG